VGGPSTDDAIVLRDRVRQAHYNLQAGLEDPPVFGPLEALRPRQPADHRVRPPPHLGDGPGTARNAANNAANNAGDAGAAGDAGSADNASVAANAADDDDDGADLAASNAAPANNGQEFEIFEDEADE